MGGARARGKNNRTGMTGHDAAGCSTQGRPCRPPRRNQKPHECPHRRRSASSRPWTPGRKLQRRLARDSRGRAVRRELHRRLDPALVICALQYHDATNFDVPCITRARCDFVVRCPRPVFRRGDCLSRTHPRCRQRQLPQRCRRRAADAPFASDKQQPGFCSAVSRAMRAAKLGCQIRGRAAPSRLASCD